MEIYELILANFAMHIDLDAKEIAHIKTRLQVKTVKKNAILLRAGETCRNIYFVNKGCLRIYHTDKAGKEHNTLFFPENWWAVDIGSFSRQRPAYYSIGAMEDTEVLFMHYTTLELLYAEVPKLERFFRILTQNGFSLYQYRVASTFSKTAGERYAMFKRQYPKLEQRIAQKHIASYLGITPIFLSVIRKRKSTSQH